MTKTRESNPNAGARILVVEDNEASRQLMSDYLEYYGYQVMTLPRGSMFASAMQHFLPQLILLDLKLPDVDGYSLLQQRQWCPDWMKVPVIVVSAFAFQADQQRALELGACQYLVKPVSLTHLKQSIHAQLNCKLAESIG